MRKAALASALTLSLSLSTSSILLNATTASAASPHDTGTGLPYAADFVYPVGNPRISPNFASTEPNGYQITQMFNNSCDPSLGQGYYYGGQYFCGHTGVDLSNRQTGGVVVATAAGVVVYAGYNGSYGEMVRIKHLLPDGSIVYSQYEHMMYGNVLVGYGQVVAMGQSIGYVGTTGFVTGAHLHFEIKNRDEDGVGYTFGNAALIYGYVDPLAFVAAHTLQVAPTPTPTLAAPASTPSAPTAAASTPSTQVLALSATAPRASSGTSSYTGDQEAVLADFYRRYDAYVTVTADHLNVRAGSGFSFAPLNSVVKGARLGYLGMAGNGWIHVALPDNIYGYVARQWVDGKVLPALPPIQANINLKPPFAQVLDTRYPARNGPKMHDEAIEVLRVGEKLTYLGTMGSWDKVILPSGRVGWVLNWYLREPGQRIDLIPAGTAQPSVSMTCPCAVTTVDSLRLRQGPGTSTPTIEGLAQGTKLGVRGYHGDWEAVTAPDGRQGYVMVRYVHTIGAVGQSAPARRSTPVTCPCVMTTVDGLNLRQGPRLSAAVIESLHGGVKLSLHGYHTSWVAVTAPDGRQGYVMVRYVHTVGAVGQSAPPSPAATSTPAANSTGTASANSATTTPTPTETSTTTDSGSTTALSPALDSAQQAAPGFNAPYVWVNVDHANVRAAPSMKAIVFSSQPRDTQLALLGTRGDWCHVETRKGVIGWMNSDLIRTGNGA